MTPSTVRRLIIETSHRKGGVHFGGCFSVVEILLAYYAPVIAGMNFKDFIAQNSLVLSKGHCGLAVYAILYALGEIAKEDFESYPDGRFCGHIKRDDSLGIGWSTGSLGHGLSVAMGLSDGGDKQVTCILGDGELNEGQCWEALMHLGSMAGDKLNVIVDNNQMMSLGFTQSIRPIEPLDKKLEAFGIKSWRVNGHDVGTVRRYFERNRHSPHALIAETIKGYGVSFMQGFSHWHHRGVNEQEYQTALAELA